MLSMITEQVTEQRVTEVKYWTCNYAEHRHMTQGVAQKCIIHTALKPRRMTNKWTTGLYKVVLELREAGHTFVSIGRRFNITGSRAKQVWATAHRLQRYGKLKSLPPR